MARWKLVFRSLHNYFVTGNFVMLTDDNTGKGGGNHQGIETLPAAFKPYRDASDYSIGKGDSVHSIHSGMHEGSDHSGSDELNDKEDEFEEGMKVYDVYAGTEDTNDMKQLAVGGDDSRPFSASGLTNFYGDDFDY